MTCAVSQVFQQVVLSIERLPTLATCWLILVMQPHMMDQASGANRAGHIQCIFFLFPKARKVECVLCVCVCVTE